MTLPMDQLRHMMEAAAQKGAALGVAMALPLLGRDKKHNRNDAAAFMGHHPTTFDTYKDKIPCVIEGRRKYWLESELIKYRASRTVLIQS